MPASLPAALRLRLRQAADPVRAPGMQAYMKSAMPYLGVSSVPLRAVCKELFAGLDWSGPEAWQADVLAIWRGAEFREERMLRAEEKAARLPAMLTVPMIVFILPPLFIVLIGPAILRVVDALGSFGT